MIRMAFRNPLTTLTSLDLSTATGQLDGSHLLAGTVTADHVVTGVLDGLVITGNNIRTAADGTARIILGPGARDAQRDLSPAITWDLDGSGVDWAEPNISANPVSKALVLRGQLAPGGVYGSQVILAKSGAVQLSAANATRQVTLSLDPTDGTIQIVGDITLIGALNAPLGPITAPNIPHTESGLLAHAYAGGAGPVGTNVTFTKPYANSIAPAMALSSNSPLIQVYYGNLTTVGVTIYSRGFGGSVPPSASYSISWTATASS